LDMKVEFFKHSLGEDEKEAIAGALYGVFLTTGPANAEFEKLFSEYLGVPHAVTVSSCTGGMHIALLALGIKPGDEVITTPMSFIATSNSVIHAGGIPRFVDVEPETGLIDPDLVAGAITPRTRGILPVHLYGQMVDMGAMRKIADERGLFVLEDSAHAIEAERDGVKPGQKGDMAAFSFYATKVITSGEGGAVTAHTAEQDDLLRKLRLHGMSAGAADRYSGSYEHWDMETLGWKYNMTNFQAAMLIPQLPKMEEWCARREAICRRYEQAFSKAGIGFPKVVPGSRSSRHLFTIWVEKRDRVLEELGKRGVGVAVNYRAIHLRKYYVERFGYRPGMFPVAEKIGDMTVSLPLYPGLRDEEADYVIEKVGEAVG
jgi:dTDP-4-amino-4,6-dideoxygalactose transaminase